MTYAIALRLARELGAIDYERLTVFKVKRRAKEDGPWHRIGAWVPVNTNQWVYVGGR